MAAVEKSAHMSTIEADQDLADEVDAQGTPYFFINGRGLVGARPLSELRAVIDEELARAKALVDQGTPREKVYEVLLANARPPPTVARAVVDAPTAQSPSRGPQSAKVTLQLWSDFQCPFCLRVMPTLDRLEHAFPDQIRVVWRNNPLAMHPDAELAAEAALEAFAQRGNPGFWAMAALLFQHQDDAGGLQRPALDAYARKLGLDLGRFSRSLDAHTHRADIDADRAAAVHANLSVTPTVVINGLVLGGAQPYVRFRKLVTRALAEAK
jgi:protein-disulfide isomerase